MKKYDNFIGAFNVLKKSNKEFAFKDEIYRIGVVGQFNLTFELSWKLLQAVLRAHSVLGAETGSPREMLKLGFKVGFLNDEKNWIKMQLDRNKSVHIYNEEDIDEILSNIFDIYIKVFEDFSIIMKQKIDELE